MQTRRLEGWLFDIDELGSEIALWVYCDDGQLLRLTEEFQQPVYAQGERAKLKALASQLHRRGIISGVRWEEREEFWSGRQIEALELHVADASAMPQLRKVAAALDRQFTFYNLDIPMGQHYLYLRRLFPLCRLACEIDESGNIIEIAATESPWKSEYRLPDLRMMNMRGHRMQPMNDESRIILEGCGEEREIELREGEKAVIAFNEFIEACDPDILLSERGDSILLPSLLRLAESLKMRLSLDRHNIVTKRKIETEGRTYFTYGKIIYKGPSYPLFGRWHIDSRNSFIYRETDLDGLVELSRLAKVPVQRMARTSPGSAMTSMEMETAISNRILVPWHKSEPEKYKTALELLTVDKGGLVFQPPVGAHEDVAEIDFASMYPAIMVRHNISPETVLCRCCENRAVPEAEYNICEKRRGLVPRTLEPLLERRRIYKQLMRHSTDMKDRDIYDSRQTAIKWMLVSCFGYLGYRNARFGRIEAHEAVTAYGRDKLLRAKELAEAAGFSVMHAITDSLWIKREGATESDVLALCEEITEVCEVEMSLEGIYRWIIFLPSKEKETRPVPARYYGVFSDGRVKARGLAFRRADTPRFIKEAQLEMLAIVSKAATLAEREGLKEEAQRIFSERMAQIESGEVDPETLVLRRTLTKGIDEYTVETRTAIAARQIRDVGVRIHPGERTEYVITDARSKDKSKRVQAAVLGAELKYDVEEYAKLLKNAADEVTG